MPRGDGTGPMGMGRMSGRGAGHCAGFTGPGCANPVGFPGGPGRGFRRMFHETGLPGWARCGYPVYAGANGQAFGERERLKNQAEFLEKELQQVKERISCLKEDE